MLTGFYTVLKDADRYLRFVFITGVTKFSQLGIFSNLNQLMDISMAPDYATICGMTKAEIERNFQPELAALAAMNKLDVRTNGKRNDETLRRISFLGIPFGWNL